MDFLLVNVLLSEEYSIISVPVAPNDITNPFASSDSFRTSVFMVLKVSKQEFVISDWDDSERL